MPTQLPQYDQFHDQSFPVEIVLSTKNVQKHSHQKFAECLWLPIQEMIYIEQFQHCLLVEAN